MVCERYKKDLIEAAAGFRAASGKLQEHLQKCSECRTTLANEQALFAAIDTCVQERANAGPPNALVARVRAAASVEPARQRRWAHVWTPATAMIALAVSIGSWNSWHSGSIRHESQVIVSSDGPEPNGELPKPEIPAASPKLIKRQRVARRNPTTNIDFEPLVPAWQKAEVDLLIESIRRGQIDGKVLMVTRTESLEIPPVVIRPIVPEPPDAGGGQTPGSWSVPVSETWSNLDRSTK